MSKQKLRVLDLFSGIGGFSLGLERTGGFETVAFCEIEEFPRKVLRKHWPEVPIYDDVRELNAARLAADGIQVDCICAGFPCQDASIAKTDGQGTDGARTGLFREIMRLAGSLEPDFILLENVPELLNRGFGDVLGALAEIGFDAEWESVSASALGAPHKRERLFIFAYPCGSRRARLKQDKSLFIAAFASLSEYDHNLIDEWRSLDASKQLLRSDNGASVAMERRRISALGNAVVPQIPELIGHAILEAERQAT